MVSDWPGRAGNQTTNLGVVGSNPAGRANALRVHSGHIGDGSYRTHSQHFRAERVGDRFEPASLVVEISEIVPPRASSSETASPRRTVYSSPFSTPPQARRSASSSVPAR